MCFKVSIVSKFLGFYGYLVCEYHDNYYNNDNFDNYFPSSFLNLSRKLLLTTETELIAMAAPAIIGLSKKPVNG